MKLTIIGLLLSSTSAFAQCTCGGYTYRSWDEPQYVELNPYEWRYQIPDSYDSYYYQSTYHTPRWHWRWVYDQVQKKDLKPATKDAKAPEGLKLSKTEDKVDKCNLRQYFVEEKAHGKDQAQTIMRGYCK
jgi:hypothetical protein